MSNGIDKVVLRNDPSLDQICTREISIMPSSINEETRTVRAAIATSTPARVYHWDVGRVIEEVLVPRGMAPVEDVPLIVMHNRWNPNSVLGSVSGFVTGESDIEGALRFGSELGDDVENIWKRVKQKLLRNVSAGYEPVKWVDIQPGQTATVAGRSYTAKQNMMLRVTTEWKLREVSIVVIPADENARIRQGSDNITNNGMQENNSVASHSNSGSPIRENNMGLIAYLGQLGLRNGADATAIRSFIGGLNAEQRAHALTLASDAERSYFDAAPSAATQTATATQTTGASAQRSADPVAQMTGAVGGDGASAGDSSAVLTAERNRVAEIYRLAGGQVPDDLVGRAISEGWTADQAGREFYLHVQRGASGPVGHGGHVGIHSRSRSTEINLPALQVGLMMRLGMEPDNDLLSSPGARAMLSRSNCDAAWLCDAAYALRNGNASDDASRAIEVASRRLRRRSLPDIAAECLRLSGQEVPEDREELIQRAYTTNQFSAIFTTNFSVRLLRGFVEYPDSTRGWVGEEDLPDFQSHDMIQADPFGLIRKKTKNVPGKQVVGGDRKESYAAERFVGTFAIDEVDMANDRLRAFQQTPMKLGASAARIRPDLVYAILLNNPTLATDSTALFATGHGNLLGSAALGSQTLSAAEAAMAIQTRNGANLDIQASHLIVPRTKRHLAMRLVGSAVLDDPANTAEYGTMNPNQGQYTVVSDPRLDNGFTDPDDPKSTIAGQPNSWFLADSRAPGIMVGYVEGMGRAPRVRPRVINRPGEYGMEWDVCLDIGVGVADYVGLLKRQSGSL